MKKLPLCIETFSARHRDCRGLRAEEQWRHATSLVSWSSNVSHFSKLQLHYSLVDFSNISRLNFRVAESKFDTGRATIFMSSNAPDKRHVSEDKMRRTHFQKFRTNITNSLPLEKRCNWIRRATSSLFSSNRMVPLEMIEFQCATFCIEPSRAS